MTTDRMENKSEKSVRGRRNLLYLPWHVRHIQLLVAHFGLIVGGGFDYLREPRQDIGLEGSNVIFLSFVVYTVRNDGPWSELTQACEEGQVRHGRRRGVGIAQHPNG